jgi:Major intrinsic protein.
VTSDRPHVDTPLGIKNLYILHFTNFNLPIEISLQVVTPHDVLTFGVSPDKGLCSTVPHESLSDFQAFAVEFLSTSLLIFTCCGVWDHRNAHQGDSNPIKFALVIILCSATVVSINLKPFVLIPIGRASQLMTFARLPGTYFLKVRN